ncbi:murein hydrolase activator EnvC family protein [Zhouia sp. PK063]|uniref:murein hydrolase activator EnvC family protein n=1 Tax=Zhouia sp. PK063 TaxID=3373602 RepID=UPI003794EEFD
MKVSSIVLFFLCCLLSFNAIGQSKEQKELEAKREQLQREIRKMNALLSEKTAERKNVLVEVQTLSQKIAARQELIRVTNQQANLINRQINTNIQKIAKLRKNLEELKKDYAQMIRKSYKGQSNQSRLMFLLSSKDFFQAYKRLQYMKQYTAYRKAQGEEIKAKTEQVQKLNQSLVVQRKEKENLIAENRKSQQSLEKERASQNDLVASIKKKENQYASEIRKKQQESDEIDRQIEKLIREAIAKSNKKSGGDTRSSNFALTPEAKLVGANFESNKGKLPWPVKEGRVVMYYGTQPHPVVKSVTIKSNGVRISTAQGAQARAVFKGKVLAVQLIRGGNKAVLIQHGNYISVYNNLSKVYVNEGDNVVEKQDIGEVFTSPNTNETILKFMIYKNSSTQNPASWIYKM